MVTYSSLLKILLQQVTLSFSSCFEEVSFPRAVTYHTGDAFDPFRKGLSEDDDTVMLSNQLVHECASKRAVVIQHVISLCGFPEDSIMLAYIDQEKWSRYPT